MNRQAEVTCRRHSGAVDISTLQTIPLFGAVPTTALQPLITCGRWRVYRRGETIVESDEEKEWVFVVAAGQARIQAVSPLGEEFPVLELGSGDVIDSTIFRLPSWLMLRWEAAADEAVMLRFSRLSFEQAIRSQPAAAHFLLGQVELHLGEVINVLGDFVFCDGLRRLAHILGRLAVRNDAHVVDVTHDELGRMAGMSRARVSELLKQLTSRRLIVSSPRRRGITVLDPERMASLMT